MSTEDSVQKIKAIFEQFEATGLHLFPSQREAIEKEIFTKIGSCTFSNITDNLLLAMVIAGLFNKTGEKKKES